MYSFKMSFRKLKKINIYILMTTISLSIIGILNIYLCTKGSVYSNPFLFSKRQLIWFLISMVALYIMINFDYRLIYNYVPIIYWVSNILLLLVWVPGIGVKVNGATGWIDLRVSLMQPAEIAKFGVILMVAKLLYDCENNINNLKNFMKIAMYVAIPMILILIQKDMGMTMVCFFIVLGMVFIAGLDMKVIWSGILSIFLAVILLWNTGIIQTHQKARLLEFFNSGANTSGNGYQLSQGIIAVGSGGITGAKKVFDSTVSPGYAGTHVPEVHTDFIFTAIAEQWGIIGSILVLGLYALLIINMLKLAKNSANIFGSLVCVGMTSYIMFAIAQNIGMTIGLIPITGITLPFVSYGGSSLLTTFIAIGVVLNIGINKEKLDFIK